MLARPDVVCRSEAGFLLEHPAQMGRIVKSKFIGHFRHSQTGCKLVLDLADNELTYMASGTLTCHLLYQITEIIR